MSFSFYLFFSSKIFYSFTKNISNHFTNWKCKSKSKYNKNWVIEIIINWAENVLSFQIIGSNINAIFQESSNNWKYSSQ